MLTRLWSLLFRAQKFDEILHLIRLQSISKGRHTVSTFYNLLLDTVFAPALPNTRQTRPAVRPDTIGPMAVLAALLAKDNSTSLAPLL